MGDHRSLAGVDLHAPSRHIVANNSGGALAQLKAIKFVGVDASNLPEIEAISSFNDTFRGLVAGGSLSLTPGGVVLIGGPINDGSEGQVVSWGLLHNVDTSSYSVGDILYSDASGDLTTTQTQIRVGEVLESDATNGVIFIDGTTNAVGSRVPVFQVTGGIPNLPSSGFDRPGWGVAQANSGIPQLRDGEILGLSISVDISRTAGTATLSSQINGVTQNGAGETVDIDAANPTSNFIEFATPIAFSAGDVLDLIVETSGWSPTTSDATVTLFYRWTT